MAIATGCINICKPRIPAAIIFQPFFTYIPSSKFVSVGHLIPYGPCSDILVCGTAIRRTLAPSYISLPFQIAPHPNSSLSYDCTLLVSTALCNVRNISKVHRNIL